MFINAFWFLFTIFRVMLAYVLIPMLPSWKTWEKRASWPVICRKARAEFRRDASAEFWAEWTEVFDRAANDTMAIVLAAAEMAYRRKSGISKLHSNLSPPQGE